MCWRMDTDGCRNCYLGEILCFPCIPNTWLHNQNVLGVYKWELKYIIGYLSNRHMIRYGVYHMFVSGLFCKPILCFVLSCGIRVASMSSVDSIPPLSGVLTHLCEYQSFLIIEFVISISSQPVCSSSSGSEHFFDIRKDQLKVFSTLFVPSVPKLSLFFPPIHRFLQGLIYLNQVSILWMWSLSILFRQCSYPVILRKILTKLQV